MLYAGYSMINFLVEVLFPQRDLLFSVENLGNDYFRSQEDN